MDFKKLDEVTSSENKEKAEKAAANQKQAKVDMAHAYHRVFATDDGSKVLQHLYQKFVVGNSPEINSPNINYEAAYKNGQAETVLFISQQIGIAEKI